MIHHLNLTPDQGFILFFGLLLFGLVGWGLYLTFGSGKKGLKDQIDEHAKMHELGIAHGHEGKRAVMTKRAQENDFPQHKHD